jgi:hypothetical protein
MLQFVTCANCGKTMPKHETGNELIDSLEPDMVWCSQMCLDEWEINNETDSKNNKNK